ncbi:hypothetical protein ACVXHB_20165 [Escherichia coli]
MKKLKGVISAAVLSLYLLTPADADGGFQVPSKAAFRPTPAM